MKKLRTYTFIDGDETKTVEAMTYRKAVKSFQGGTKSQVVRVEWEAKKGGEYEKIQSLPLGRKIRQAAILDAKRLAAKKRLEEKRGNNS
jgi:hypothetical protein